MPKEKEGKFTTEQKREAPQHSKELTKAIKKATALEKGKWIPKVAIMPVNSYQEQLPSTSSHSNNESSTYNAATQRQTQPLSGKNPLDAVKQLIFILRTFNSKQVDAQWRQFMASKVTGKGLSPAKSLGPNLLQDPPLAQH